MDALGHRHFERRESASHARTLLAACAEVGLDAAAAEAMLASDELVADVWRSYGATVREHGIRAIPLFVFGPARLAGPFRPDGVEPPVIVRGSADPETFVRVLEALLERDAAASAAAARRAAPPRTRAAAAAAAAAQ